MKTVFSGIQPSGIPTIGNYIGVMQNFIKMQNFYNCYFCIANEHAITIKQNPQILKNNIKILISIFLSIGLDPNKSTIFLQSDVPAHTELAWIIQCHSNFNQLKRMIQFKNKSIKNNNINISLLTYPTLMISDIILYDTDIVPIGSDQKQHLELTKKFIKNFNKIYNKNIFKIPIEKMNNYGKKIMSLQMPTKKMSKSDKNNKNFILLLDKPELIIKKIKMAKTDSYNKINYNINKQPGISNLLNIFSSINNISINKLIKKYNNLNYNDFKLILSNEIIKKINPIQKKFYKFIKSEKYIKNILKIGAKKANLKANLKLKKIKKNYRFRNIKILFLFFI